MRAESASAPVRAGRTGRHVCTWSLLWWLFLLTSSSNHPLPPGLVPASFAQGLPASDRYPATNVTSQHSDGDASKREVRQRSKNRSVESGKLGSGTTEWMRCDEKREALKYILILYKVY